jgi:hypothetical protein
VHFSTPRISRLMTHDCTHRACLSEFLKTHNS